MLHKTFTSISTNLTEHLNTSATKRLRHIWSRKQMIWFLNQMTHTLSFAMNCLFCHIDSPCLFAQPLSLLCSIQPEDVWWNFSYRNQVAATNQWPGFPLFRPDKIPWYFHDYFFQVFQVYPHFSRFFKLSGNPKWQSSFHCSLSWYVLRFPDCFSLKHCQKSLWSSLLNAISL